jgi:hypothetical protein
LVSLLRLNEQRETFLELFIKGVFFAFNLPGSCLLFTTEAAVSDRTAEWAIGPSLTYGSLEFSHRVIVLPDQRSRMELGTVFIGK